MYAFKVEKVFKGGCNSYKAYTKPVSKDKGGGGGGGVAIAVAVVAVVFRMTEGD